MILRQSTAGQKVVVKLVDAVDGFTPETGVSGPTITLSKAGAAFAPIADGTWAELGSGCYSVQLDADDTDTLGLLVVHVEATGCRNVEMCFEVGRSDGFVKVGELTAAAAAAVAAALAASTGWTAGGTMTLATAVKVLLAWAAGDVTGAGGNLAYKDAEDGATTVFTAALATSTPYRDVTL